MNKHRAVYSKLIQSQIFILKEHPFSYSGMLVLQKMQFGKLFVPPLGRQVSFEKRHSARPTRPHPIPTPQNNGGAVLTTRAVITDHSSALVGSIPESCVQFQNSDMSLAMIVLREGSEEGGEGPKLKVCVEWMEEQGIVPHRMDTWLPPKFCALGPQREERPWARGANLRTFHVKRSLGSNKAALQWKGTA